MSSSDTHGGVSRGGGQGLDGYAGSDRGEGYRKPGSAADYYNDQSQSVPSQARALPELISLASASKPSKSSKTSKASVSSSSASGKPNKVSRVSQLSGSELTAGTPAGAATSYASAGGSGQAQGAYLGGANPFGTAPTSPSTFRPSSLPYATSSGTTPNQQSSTQSAEYYYAPPPSVGKQPMPFNAAAAAAVGLGARAYAMHHHNSHGQQSYNPGQPPSASTGATPTNHGATYQTPSANTDMATPHTHKGSISKLVDWWKDYEDVQKMEEFTEHIGVCKYCFDPRTSPADAPRKHYYHRKRSNDSLRRRSSEPLRRTNSHNSSHGRIDKDSRYHSSDNERRKKTSSWLGDGVAGAVGYGLARLWESNRNFDDTYSVRAGQRSDVFRQSSHRGSVERGVVYGDKHSSSLSLRTGDRKRDKEHSRSKGSHSGSRDRRSTMLGTAAITGIGGSAAVSSHKSQSEARSSRGSFVRSRTSSRDHSPRAVLVRGKPRGRSGSRSPRFGGILNFTGRPYQSRPQPSVVTSRSSRSSDRERPAGMFGRFFAASPKHQRREHRKKSKGFFTFNNYSSSSANSDLAYGSFVSRSSHNSERTPQKTSEEQLSATLLGIGATAAAIAAAKRGRQPLQRHLRDIENTKSAKDRQKARNLSSADNDWESASEYEGSDSVDSNLAFGHFNFDGKRTRRQSSPDSLTSQSSGTDKWSWRWGSRKQKAPTLLKHRRNPDIRMHDGSHDTSSAGASSGRASSRGDASVSGISSPSSMPPMRYVHPVSTEDPTAFDASGSMISGAHSEHSSTMSGRLDLVQIESNSHSRPDVFRRAQTEPLATSSAKDAILMAGAAAAGAGILSNGKTKSLKDDGSASVRFEVTEKQAKKDMRERRQQKLRVDEKFREDEDQASKEAAARHHAEAQVHKQREEAEYHRVMEELRRADDEQREEREAAEARAWMQARLEIEANQREVEYRRREMAAADAALLEDEQRRADESDCQQREYSERRGRAEEQRELLQRDDLPRSDLPNREDSAFHDDWSVPVGAGLTGAVVGAELADRRHQDEQHYRSESAPYVISGNPYEMTGGASLDDRLYENESPEPERELKDDGRESDTAARAAHRDSSNMENRMEPPALANATFSSSADLPIRPKGKETIQRPIEDNGVREYTVTEVEFDNSHDASPLPHQPGSRPDTSDDGSPESASWTVPTLNFIAPTPPVSISGTTGGNKSPVTSRFPAEDGSQEQERHGESSAERKRYGSISWGHDHPREYEVREPEPATYEFSTPDQDIARETYQEETPYPRLYERSIIADLHDGYSGRAYEDYKAPYVESVTDLAFRPYPPEIQAVHGFVEGEVDEPTPLSEGMPHVPGGCDDYDEQSQVVDIDAAESATHDTEEESRLSPKEKKKREKAAKRAERDRVYVTSERPHENEPLEDFAIPLSKKEKKRRDRLAKQGLLDEIDTSNAVSDSDPAIPTTSATADLTESTSSIAYDDQEDWSSVKTKMSKRASAQFKSPTAASPLRSEIVWDDHMPRDDARPKPEDERQETNETAKQPHSGVHSRSRAMSESAELPKRTRFSPPDNNHDARSVESAPIDRYVNDRARSRRSFRHDDDNGHNSSRRSRSVAASEPSGVHEKRKRRFTRDSGDFDDSTSIISARSSRSARDAHDDRSTTSKKEKKGGLLSLLGLKSTDNTSKSKRIDKDDNRAGEGKHHRRRKSDGDLIDDNPRSSSRSRHRDESGHSSTARHRNNHREAVNIDDSQSQTSERHRRRRRRYKDGSDEEGRSYAEDDTEDAPAPTSESRRKHRHHEEATDHNGHDTTVSTPHSCAYMSKLTDY